MAELEWNRLPFDSQTPTLATPASLPVQTGLDVLAAANFSVPAVLGLSRRIDVLSTQIYVAMNSYPVNYTRVAIVALTLVLLLVGLLVQQLQHLARKRLGIGAVGDDQELAVDEAVRPGRKGRAGEGHGHRGR